MTLPVAADIDRVKRRVREFLERDSRDQQHLRGLLGELEPLGTTVFFGGMLRDIFLGGLRRFAPDFSSDIDIVVDAPASRLEQKLRGCLPRVGTNAFGGHRVACGAWTVDVWALQSTWAIRERLVPFTGIETLIRTTFFTWDACIYDVSKNSICMYPGALEQMKEWLLDVNLEPNPHAEKISVRILRWLIEERVGLSPRLASYLYRSLGDSSVARIRDYAIQEGWLWWKPAMTYIYREMEKYLGRRTDTPFRLPDEAAMLPRPRRYGQRPQGDRGAAPASSTFSSLVQLPLRGI